MIIRQIALVSQTNRIEIDELMNVAASLQKQITRDFIPIWKKKALISAFPNGRILPGYWPIFIRDDINEPGAAGFHTDRNQQPFAMVQYSPSWSLTTSHEMLEMLADPYGNKLKLARSIMPNQGKVQYLVEICDPSEDDQFAYDIQGVQVSDFYTPNYFDKLKIAGQRYSFTGAITEPLQILPGGYLSWNDPTTGDWWQATFFGAKLKFTKLLGMKKLKTGSLRSRVDSLTNPPKTEHANLMMRAITDAPSAKLISKASADYWEEEIQFVLKQYKKK